MAKKPMSYKEASKIRNIGLGGQISQRIQAGQGIGESIGKSISDKFRAHVKGVKETFDPMNIGKKLTFGSSAGASIVGKMMGRSQEDIEYFSGVKAKKDPMKVDRVTTNVQNIKKNDSISDSLGKLYVLMKEIEEHNKKERELKKDFAKEEEDKAQERHEEILNALGGKSLTRKKRLKAKVGEIKAGKGKKEFEYSGGEKAPKKERKIFTAKNIESVIGYILNPLTSSGKVIFVIVPGVADKVILIDFSFPVST